MDEDRAWLRRSIDAVRQKLDNATSTRDGHQLDTPEWKHWDERVKKLEAEKTKYEDRFDRAQLQAPGAHAAPQQDAILQRLQAMTLADIRTELQKHQPKTLPAANTDSIRAFVTRPLEFAFWHPFYESVSFYDARDDRRPRIRAPNELAIHLLEIKYLKLPESDSSEDSWHHIHDYFFRDVFVEIISLFVRPVNHNRNRIDPKTSQTNTRPDAIIKVGGFVVLRGEEKSGDNSIDTADQELVDKMKEWSVFLYGRMPYIFAYTTRAEHVRLHFITQPRQARLIGDYDLNSTSSRYELTEAVVRMALLVPQLIDLVPQVLKEANIYCEQTISRQDDKCTLKFSNFNVLKTWTQPTTPATMIAYTELAKLSSKQNRPRGLICAMVKNKNKGAFAVRMTPLGFTLPSWTQLTDDQLLIAIRDVITGLNTWHDHGFCHGDVRPPNIVCLNAELSEWALIDFDYSYKPTDMATIDWNHPCVGETLSFASDWKQVAALIGPREKWQQLNEVLKRHTKPRFDVARVRLD